PARGLWRFMPLTGLTALVASCSIAGVPLFSGFVSKWAIYGAAIQGNTYAGYLAVCGIVAILTSALTLASFVKFFGAAFLSRTSSVVSERAARGRLEVHWTMQGPQVALAAVCVAVGLAPAGALMLVRSALANSPDGLGAILARSQPPVTSATLGVSLASGEAAFVPAALLVALGAAMAIVWWLSRLGASRRRADVPWLCGYAQEADCNRYAAHGFYGEVKGPGRPGNGRGGRSSQREADTAQREAAATAQREAATAQREAAATAQREAATAQREAAATRPSAVTTIGAGGRSAGVSPATEGLGETSSRAGGRSAGVSPATEGLGETSSRAGGRSAGVSPATEGLGETSSRAGGRSAGVSPATEATGVPVPSPCKGEGQGGGKEGHGADATS
ncbi:MAG: hypothetical protein FJX72_18445, partial [Armatimonadetes bacterium]|nr:hypothetical protein [Armatimonadota bacterium]